jgi:hypothetical protein
LTRPRQLRIDHCFDIDEATSVPPPRNSSVQQAAPGYGKRIDVKRLAAVSEGGYWWNPTTQELIEILPKHHPDRRQNQALITEAIRRWNGGTLK